MNITEANHVTTALRGLLHLPRYGDSDQVEPATLNASVRDLVARASKALGMRVITESELDDALAAHTQILTPEQASCVVYQALGEASTCWRNLDDAGEFDAPAAIAVGERLCAALGLPGFPGGEAVSLAHGRQRGTADGDR